jgi:hypothetical protein
MRAPEALWSQELRHHALSTSKTMHDYFAFMHEKGWYGTVVDRALDEVVEFLALEDVPQQNHLEEMKLALVRLKPEQVGNAMFRFILNDTLEKIGTSAAEPWHFETYNFFWFRWRERARAKMRAALAELPEFIEE